MTKVEKKRISILGCGWLGLPLAQRLVELNISNELKGSTTSDSRLALFNASGIKGYCIDLSPDFNGDPESIRSFLDTDILIISVPPKLAKAGHDFHVQQIRSVIEHLKNAPVKEIIYTSSTSVYPDLNRVVLEEDITEPGESASPAIVQVETALAALRPERIVSILRLGGLLGYNRIPAKYVAGQKEITTGSLPVNYIHRDDAVGIIVEIIKSGTKNETFNLVAPLHPTRREVYLKGCIEFGWEAPTFSSAASSPDFKIISGQKLDDFYNYHFKYADPLDFYYNPNL